MNKGSSDKNTSTEVLTEEEDLRGDLHPLDFLRDDRKSATSDGRSKHDDCAVINSKSAPISVGFNLHTAATCKGKSYSAPSASLPHVGFSMVDIVNITTKKTILKKRITESNPELPAALSPATVRESKRKEK